MKGWIMIKKYYKLSLLLGLPGFLLHVIAVNLAVGIMMSSTGTAPTVAIACVILLAGSVPFIVGLGYSAKAKGRHPAWALLGFLGLFGLIMLALMRDRERTRKAS
jgi:hypothetical protein